MLDIEILHLSQIHTGLQAEIDRVSHDAFSHPQPEQTQADTSDPFPDMEWSESEWLLLGRRENELVSLVGVLKRQILVGGSAVWVGGVGGVATLPEWRGHGFAGVLMRRAAEFMRVELQVPFGMLVCGAHNIPLYGHLGYINVASEWTAEYQGLPTAIPDNIMVISLSGLPWPSGPIDICGKPW